MPGLGLLYLFSLLLWSADMYCMHAVQGLMIALLDDWFAIGWLYRAVLLWLYCMPAGCTTARWQAAWVCIQRPFLGLHSYVAAFVEAKHHLFACTAGFGTLVNATDACLACPVGTYSPGIQIKRLRPNGRRGSNSASAGSTPAIMPLTPRRTPCVPCGNNFTTRLTQSTKPWDCIPPDDVGESTSCHPVVDGP